MTESKATTDPLLGPSNAHSHLHVVEDPKEAERRSKAIDAQLAAERRSADAECTVWVTAPGNGIETLARWLQLFARVRTSVATTPSQSNIDVAWNDVWSSAPPQPVLSSSSSSSSSSSTVLGGSGLLSAPNGEHRRSLSHGSTGAPTSGASSPSSPLQTSSPASAHVRQLSGAFSSTALREGWIPFQNGSTGTTSSHDEHELAKFRIIATDWMGAAEMKKWLHQMQRVDIIMFFFCLADYDEVNPASGTNRLMECINWFEEVATNRWCRDTDLLIIFTKTEVTADKLRRVPFVRHFPAYDGVDTVAAVHNWVFEQCWNRVRRSGRKADSVAMYAIADDMTPTLTCLKQSWNAHNVRNADHH